MTTTDIEHTTNTTEAAALAISLRAAGELTTLRARIPELQQTLRDLTDEQATMETSRVNQASVLSHAHQLSESATKQHKEAREYAAFAVDSVGERDAMHKVRELETAALSASVNYTQERSKYEQAEAARASRLESLRSEYDQTRDELTHIHARIAEVERIERRSLAELGQSCYERLALKLQEIQGKISLTRDELTGLKLQQTQFLDEAKAELSAWPALARQLRPTETIEDEVTQTMQSFITLLENLIHRNGDHLQIMQDLPGLRGSWHTWKETFLLHQQDLQSLNTRRELHLQPASLQAKRQTMLNLLAEYRRSKS
jgi:hypothetical protein